MTSLPTQSGDRRLGLVIDLDTCVGCHACATNCKEWNTSGHSAPLTDVNAYQAEQRGVWFNRVFTYEVGGQGPAARTVHFPKNCLHCQKPDCVTVCPTGASYKRAEDGIVLIDHDRCIGCKLCSWACAYGARVEINGVEVSLVPAGHVLGSAQAAWLIQNMPRAGTQEFARLHDALLIMFDAYSQKVQTLLVKFAQEASPTPRGISPSTEMLMGQLAELDDATDDAVSECLNQLQLLQKQTSGSLYERTQMAVLDTKLRRLQDDHAKRCREFKIALSKSQAASALLDSA